MGRVIGIGAFSQVRECVDTLTGRALACKVVCLKQEGAADMVRTEVDVMSCLETDDVLSIHDFCVRGEKAYIVMEMMGGGDLAGYVEERGSVPECDARDVISSVLNAVIKMKEKSVVHRDIKLENILLRHAGSLVDVKVADFGLSKMTRGGPLRTACGTLSYCAPEVIGSHAGGYSHPSDVWASGVVMYVMLSGYPPFDSSDGVPALLSSMRRGVSFDDPAWELVGEDAKDLIGRMLIADPSARITAEDALAHPWMTGGRPATV